MLELIQIVVINVVAKLLKFAFELGTSFFVTKSTYGEFALILSYIMIFTKISSFGIQNIMVRDVPKYSNYRYIFYLFFNSSTIIFIISAILYLTLYLFSFNYINPTVYIIFLSNSFNILYSTYLRSIREVKLWIYFQDINIYIIYFTLLSILYIFNSRELNISFILNIYAISTVGALVSTLIYLKFKREFKLISKLSLKKMRYIATHSMPVLFTGLTYLIISRIDIIMLERYVSLELVGEYNIIARVTLQILFFNQVIVSYYYPRLSKMFAERRDFSAIALYNTKFVLLSFISVSLISSALFIAIRDFNLFALLNIKNGEALYRVFMTLTITQLIYSAICFYGNILIYIHRQKMEYFNNLIVLILAILLNVILIPLYGVWGASIATSISLIVGNLLQMAQVKYFTGTLFISFRRR